MDDQEQRRSDPPQRPVIDPAVSADTAVLTSRLRSLMDERNWNIHRLSGKSGVSERHLGEIVRGGVHRPREDTIRRLADALRVPSTYLLGSDEYTTEITIALLPKEVDVLSAASAVTRETVAELVRRAVTRHIHDIEQDASISPILDAIEVARDRKGSDHSC